MAISPRDQRFIESRRERRRIGLFVMPFFLTLLIAVWGLFFVALPLSVNPWVVIGRIEQRDLEPGALTMYAVMATILMNVVFALLAACLVLVIAWARHERRYLKILGQPAEPSLPVAAPSAVQPRASDPSDSAEHL